MKVLHDSVRSGFNQLAGKPPMYDPAALYKKLKPADFKALIQKYGEDKVIKFIQHMEYKNGSNR